MTSTQIFTSSLSINYNIFFNANRKTTPFKKYTEILTRKFIDDNRERHDLLLPQHLSPGGATTHSVICVVSHLFVCFLGSRRHVSFSSNCWIPVTSQSGVQGPLSKCLLNCSYNGMKWQLGL